MLAFANFVVNFYTPHLPRYLNPSNLAWQHLKLFVFLIAISERSSMDLAPTLQTILNRHCWLVLCKAGVQSMHFSNQSYILLTSILRCTAPANDLDSVNNQFVRRSQPHTELLVEGFELGTLWDEYGLVGDIIVCTSFCISTWILINSFSHSLTIFLGLTFMSFYHLIYYISWLKVPLRTILLHGWIAISKLNTQHQEHRRFLMILISGIFAVSL